MKNSLKFIGWKLAELAIYVVGFPFLFIGAWLNSFSDWCHDRARGACACADRAILDWRPEKKAF
jgi:hypothetical protein